MEENVAKLIQEQLLKLNHSQEEIFQKPPKQDDWDDEIPKKCPQSLAEEEESLRTYLGKLKKENFGLRTSIKAWQATLETKLDEFNKADLKLEELHNEIWAERDRFCSRLEKFNEEYGVLSKWWETQVKAVNELESLGGKASEDEKEVENLEKEVRELKDKIEQIRKGKAQKNPDTAEEHTNPRTESKTDQPKQVTKKVKFSEVVKEHNIAKTGGCGSPANDLYSVVDLEKMKIAKRRRKNNFFSKDKTILQSLQH